MAGESAVQPSSFSGGAIPLRLRVENGILNFISTTIVFGTPVDVAISEVAIEAFFPADAATVELLAQVCGNLGEAMNPEHDRTEVELARRPS